MPHSFRCLFRSSGVVSVVESAVGSSLRLFVLYDEYNVINMVNQYKNVSALFFVFSFYIRLTAAIVCICCIQLIPSIGLADCYCEKKKQNKMNTTHSSAMGPRAQTHGVYIIIIILFCLFCCCWCLGQFSHFFFFFGMFYFVARFFVCSYLPSNSIAIYKIQ